MGLSVVVLPLATYGVPARSQAKARARRSRTELAGAYKIPNVVDCGFDTAVPGTRYRD
jgi:hypothetical protein